MDDKVKRILRETKVIATVGFSSYPHKPSHYVPAYMLRQGYRVIPVHPRAGQILGQQAYASLEDVPEPVDLVQIFRPSHKVRPHVEQAIAIGARFVWMQAGIADPEAARLAEQAGLEVVMDRCMLVDHRQWKAGGGQRAPD
ncbi:MAG TPA: CoA-binding protein [Anaerolineales bacterium]|jgi:hypothetical protein